MCNALVDLIDAGATAGYMQMRTGDPPATPAAANTGLLLVTHTFSDPAFSAAGAPGVQPTGQAKMISPGVPDPIVDSGDVGHFRMFDSNNTCVMQGAIGTDLGNPDLEVGIDLETSAIAFQLGGEVAIQALFIIVPPT
jgi:hypothetical protein